MKKITILLILVFSIVVIISAAIIFILGGLIVYDKLNEPENITIELDSPKDVVLDEEFDVVIAIKNLGNKNETLRDVDIPSEYFDYIGLIESKPAYMETFLGQVSGDYNFRYLMEIPAKKELVVILKFEAIKEGSIKDTFDVCINTPANCFTQSLNISVTAK